MAETETPTAEKQQLPIVPFLRIPEGPGEKPYLSGSKCRSCGAVYLGPRMACGRCLSTEPMEELHLSDRGELHVFSVVHQSAPGVPVPYIAAIVDLPEGVSVRCNIEGVEPDPKNLRFGMPVEMFTETVHTDREGNDIVAFKFRPAKDS
ncbi:MAG: Zn-ribbon domain-containing OB-fold protein [Dehalococcoidia bacterium]|nr:Zn-ribbon domain-containing OB-fold protein [Dehalococcoidia bacterium]